MENGDYGNDKRIDRFLDPQGRIRSWPAKLQMKQVVLTYLAGKFTVGRTYSEKEVNQILMAWHSFGDYFLLRRGLIDGGYLARTPDGASYWKLEQPAEEAGSS